LAALGLSLIPAWHQPILAQGLDVTRAEQTFPYDSEVEGLFNEGMDAFRKGAFEPAIEAFRDLMDRPVNRRTTSAMMMAGKAEYAIGRYDQAIAVLEELLRRYPETTYAAAARETLRRANRWNRLHESVSEDVLELAVLLPLTENSRRFSHSLLTGVRVAVDAYNRNLDGQPVRILFRDSGGSGESASRAVERLAREAMPDLILGPLFSEEAVAAAEISEAYRIPMLVPLATDGDVTRGKDFVFQANPTYEMRGRAMARYAVQRRRHMRLGVVVETGTFAHQMARAFSDEVRRLGGEIPVALELESRAEWYTISDSLEADALTQVNGLYIPVTGENAPDLVQIGIDEIDQLSPDIALFGNGEWDALQRFEQAERHGTVCGLDYRIDSTDARVVEFVSDFFALAEREPDRPAFMGYDVTTFMLGMMRSQSRDVAEAIRRAPPFRGLSTNIQFRDAQVNQSLFFAQYREGRLVIVE
jgi:ABC-type branched-subunit amino acid transport system substrate-binding protein